MVDSGDELIPYGSIEVYRGVMLFGEGVVYPPDGHNRMPSGRTARMASCCVRPDLYVWYVTPKLGTLKYVGRRHDGLII